MQFSAIEIHVPCEHFASCSDYLFVIWIYIIDGGYNELYLFVNLFIQTLDKTLTENNDQSF